MGASSREFLQIRMEEHDYRELPPEVQDKLQIHTVKVEEQDYSYDELWCKLRSESIRAFKKQKEREYDLRNNFKNK